MNPPSGRRRAAAAVLASCLLGPVLAAPPVVTAATLPTGFTESVVINGLSNPTVVRFASDGRVFVAEKSGIVKIFDSLTDTTPATFVDLRAKVHDFWDRGLLGMALAPGFPSDPYVYLLYAYDHILGDDPANVPRWGDACPNPPGATADGCVVSGRLSRFAASGNSAGAEQVLIEDWCQQYPSHSIGSLAFGADGKLYVTSGDGASFNWADYGQDGSPVNPCGDPVNEGGALRSLDLRTTGDPVGLDGTVLRLEPSTGAGAAGNPLASSPDANARRIVADGLRNPFRMALRPGTNEVWMGDVGWGEWEEIDRLVNPTDGTVDDFGWPCYEGNGRQGSYDSLDLPICENLYAAGSGAVVNPHFTYRHSDPVVAGEPCDRSQGSSTAGLAFYQGGPYPAEYDGALFFADYSRDCIWVMRAGANGLPDPATRATFVTGAANPVHLEIGPGGDLFYVDLGGGTIRRITYFVANQPPTARFTANPTNGLSPLNVAFDGRASSDPDGDPLTYAWDLDGDGAFDDATGATTSWTYTTPGSYAVRLRVSDPSGATGTSSTTTITVNNRPPVPTIEPAGGPWKVGDTIAFSGSATDPDEGLLAASRLSWQVILKHCPTSPTACHDHPLQTLNGVAAGSLAAPDHEYPAYLEIRLTATDSQGLSATVTQRRDPQTVTHSFATDPPGLALAVGSSTAVAPFDRTVIVGSTLSMTAPTTQALAGVTYSWTGWSDGGARSHAVAAPTIAGTWTASYIATANVAVSQSSAISGSTVTFRITTRNLSNIAAEGVTLVDTPSGALDFRSAESPGGCSWDPAAREATCPLGTIPPNGTVTTTIEMAIVDIGAVFNTVTATVSPETPDISGDNNTTTIEVRVARVVR